MSKRDDYFAQILRANGDPVKLELIKQDICRRKAAKKLAATLALAPGFKFPTELSAEQCTADEVAEFHASLIPEGSKVVDLTAGLGIDDFHIARRATSVLSVEINRDVAGVLEPNSQALGLTNLKSCCCDCVDWLKTCGDKFDVAFIDPARRGDAGQRLFSLSDCQPNVLDLLDEIERIAPVLYIKASPMLDLSKTVGELRNVSRIFAVGTKSECKELLVEVDFRYSGVARIFAVTVGHYDAISEIEFERNETYGDYAAGVKVDDIIGEPWPAVMKIQPHGLFPQQLHPSTLLYLNPDADFPGERYRIYRIEEFSSSAIKRLSREKLEASVAVRNFPLQAEELRKRLKNRECENVRLMGTTLCNGRQVLLFMHKV